MAAAHRAPLAPGGKPPFGWDAPMRPPARRIRGATRPRSRVRERVAMLDEDATTGLCSHMQEGDCRAVRLRHDPIPQYERDLPILARDLDEGDGVGECGQCGDDGGKGGEEQIAHGYGQERPAQGRLIRRVAAHGSGQIVVEMGVRQERRIGPGDHTAGEASILRRASHHARYVSAGSAVQTAGVTAAKNAQAVIHMVGGGYSRMPRANVRAAHTSSWSAADRMSVCTSVRRLSHGAAATTEMAFQGSSRRSRTTAARAASMRDVTAKRVSSTSCSCPARRMSLDRTSAWQARAIEDAAVEAASALPI